MLLHSKQVDRTEYCRGSSVILQAVLLSSVVPPGRWVCDGWCWTLAEGAPLCPGSAARPGLVGTAHKTAWASSPGSQSRVMVWEHLSEYETRRSTWKPFSKVRELNSFDPHLSCNVRLDMERELEMLQPKTAARQELNKRNS